MLVSAKEWCMQALLFTTRPSAREIASQPGDHSGAGGNLLAVAAVFPEQFYDTSASGYRETSGEVALMRAILADALSCFQRQFLSSGRRAQRLAREAEEWFRADDPHWLFSFVNICAVLGLDPGYIRVGLRRWQQQQTAKPQQKKLHRRAVLPPHSLSIAA
jgi:hypothetical protein